MQNNTVMGITIRRLYDNTWDCTLALAEVKNGRWYNQQVIREAGNNYTQLKKRLLSKCKISLPNKADLEFVFTSDQTGCDFYKIPGTLTAEDMIFPR